MDYQKILKGIHQEIEPYATIGKQADYIPALAKINPDQFGMCIHTIQGETFMHGEATTGFSIQSISKVLAYLPDGLQEYQNIPVSAPRADPW